MAMAITVSTRSVFRRLITSTHKPLSQCSNPKPRHFSTKQSNSPEFTHQSQYRKLISLADVFQRYGFPASQLHDLLSKNRFLIFSSSSDIENSLKILMSLKRSQEFLVSVVNNCPWILDSEFLKNWELGISELGIPNASSLVIRNVLEVSRKLGMGPGDVSGFVSRLKGLGFSDGTVARVLEEFPMVLVMNEDGIRDRIEFLVGVGIDKNQIDWVFNGFPRILACGVQTKLNPLLDEFEDLGFSLDVVRREILRDPGVLGLELGELSRCVELLRTLKCRVVIKEKIHRDGAFRAGIEVKRKVDCLCRYGLIRRDAFKILRREPRAILYVIEDIEKKLEFLIRTMKLDVLWVVDVPEYLGVNFEKQIIPRYDVIEYLRSKGGLGGELGLKGLIKLSRQRFYSLYVKPYPECEKLFGRFARRGEVKGQHPVGMWKLFKPKEYAESKEDLKNIKSFMEMLV